MIFDSSIGKVYDTIFFSIAFFNRDNADFQARVRKHTDLNLTEIYFREVKEKVDVLPSMLAPFFYTDQDSQSMISQLFTDRFPMLDGKIDNLFEAIKSNKASLRQNLLALFADDSKRYAFLESVSFSVDQTALLFGEFDQTIEILCDYLKTVYQAVEQLHSNHQDKISEFCKRSESDAGKHFLAEVTKFPVEKIENATFAYSLLNQYMECFFARSDKIVFLLGIVYDKFVIPNEDSFAEVDNFLIACSGERRVKMIHALIENGEMTGSQMAKYLGCPPTTLTRPLSILLENNIIYLSRREGIQSFYRLNVELFKKIIPSFNHMFNKILESGNVDDTNS